RCWPGSRPREWIRGSPAPGSTRCRFSGSARLIRQPSRSFGTLVCPRKRSSPRAPLPPGAARAFSPCYPAPAKMPMTPEARTEEPEKEDRPKAVTVIGRIWLIAAIFFLLVAVVDLVLWEVLRPAIPTILDYAARRDARLKFLSPLLEHYVTVKSVEAV